MVFELYNNRVCVVGGQLYNSETPLISKTKYQNLTNRDQLIVVRRGGNGRTALVEFDTMRSDIKEAVIKQYGDPNKIVHRSAFRDMIEVDTKAQDFYNDYTLDNGTALPEPSKKEYLATANILNAIQTVVNNRLAMRKALGGSTKGIWEKIVKIVHELPQHTYPHKLPTNVRRFRDKLKSYHSEGYEVLIHKNFCNKNSEKINEDAKLWVLSRWADQVKRCATVFQLWQEYNKKAEEENWKPLKDKETLHKYLNLEHVKPLWYGHRYGELKSKERLNYQHTTMLPTLRDSLWYGDGTKLNYYFQDEAGNVKTVQVYEVIDVYSEVFLGYHISKTEDYKAQYAAFKMAIKTAEHKPYQIGVDNQGGHKKLTTGNFLQKIARLSIKTQPYNGKSKTIESAFGRFQQQFLAQDWFFTGQNITAKKEESKSNMEFILANKSSLPTLDEVKELYAKRRQEWNEAIHYKTNEPRLEMYLGSRNPKTKKVGILDMVDLFWVQRPKPITVTPYGISFQEQKVEYQYMVYGEPNLPDIKWLRSNIDKKLYVKFDPDDMSLIYLYEKTPLGLKQYAVAETKVVVHRGKQEQEAWEAEWMAKINQMNQQSRVDTYDEMEAILEQHGATVEQQGLRRPKLSGIKSTYKKKGRKPKATAIGKHQKEVSNRVLITTDGKEVDEADADIYDLM